MTGSLKQNIIWEEKKLMFKTCKEIAEDIQELKKNLQKYNFCNISIKNKNSEKLNNEISVENKEKNRNTSRTKT